MKQSRVHEASAVEGRGGREGRCRTPKSSWKFKPSCFREENWMCEFPVAAVTNDHIMAENSIDLLSNSVKGQKSKIKVLAKLVPPEGSRENLCPALSGF
jgi:hypothetical protein